MNQKTPKQITHWLSVIVIGIALGFALQFVRAWTEPTVAPPGGNVGAPINTGAQKQTKSGDICTNATGSEVCLGSVGGGVPKGAVMSFNLTACPVGWSELVSARGRYLVGSYGSAGVGNSVGQALTPGENRPTGNHTHGYSTLYHSDGNAGLQAGAGTLNYVGWSTGGTGTPDGTNAPYIQLLTCQKI